MVIYSSTGIDNTIFEEAYRCNLNLVCAGNNKLRRKLEKRVDEKVETVRIISYPDKNEGIDKKTPGVTDTEYKVNEYIVNKKKDILVSANVAIYDNKKYDLKGLREILHVEGHELFHVLSSVIPGIMKDNINVFVDNDKVYYNALGYYCINSKEGFKKLGVMFCETLTDILTTVSLNSYNKDYNHMVDANTIFRKNYNTWKQYVSGYSFFTSLTRLAIAAFSNDPNADFDEMINNDNNIFFGRVKCRNGEFLIKNDFLYSYMADPMHVKREFEKIEGNGLYDTFLESIDAEFNKTIKTGHMNKKIIKLYMQVLTSFFNSKLDKYYSEGLFNLEDVIKLTNTFNEVWNEVQKEYGIFFSKNEIIELKNSFEKKQKKRIFLF